ncbi:MAG: SDR family oxidoreductase [Planctomycetota bacterium]
MRVLIIGATGMLGHMACRVLARRHEVHATCRGGYDDVPALAQVIERTRCSEHLDPTRAAPLGALLEAVRPQVVLNCVGAIRQKPAGRDPLTAIPTNALLPHRLAAACDEFGAKLIAVSTDCVFSGQRGGYRETDAPDPVDLYGRSKLLGEVTVPPHLTLRTSLIGRQLVGHEGLVEWFLRQRGSCVTGYVGAMFSGLTTAAFCGAVATLVEEHPRLTGLYHVASAPISKFELLDRLGRALELDVTLAADDRVQCDRSLDASRLLRDAGWRAPTWQQMLSELVLDASTYDAWHTRG